MRQRILIYLTSLILLTVFLSACGFRFRNQHELPQQLRILYLQSNDPYGPFTISLKQALRSSGVELVDAASEASITLDLQSAHTTVIANSIGPSSQARVYSVNYTVIFALLNSVGAIILPAQHIVVNDTLTLNANQLLDSNNQLKILEEEMRREAIRQIYNRLSSQQVLQLVSQPIQHSRLQS